MRSDGSKKDLRVSHTWTTILKIRDKRVARVLGQWQPNLTASLALNA